MVLGSSNTEQQFARSSRIGGWGVIKCIITTEFLTEQKSNKAFLLKHMLTTLLTRKRKRGKEEGLIREGDIVVKFVYIKQQKL